VVSVSNCGIGLQLAVKALGICGEVITTPFSYVATTSSLIWEGLRPVFADIEADTLTMDPAAMESAITGQTEAILATHVYGNPCDVLAIEALASKHGLAVIYDAAHAFGVRYQNRNLLEYGDISVVSMHATKLVHSGEGGFITGSNNDALSKIEWMRRFGHRGQTEFYGVGTNAKMSELHAALGLCCLNHADRIITHRRAVSRHYDQLIAEYELPVSCLALRPETEYNYSYYPVLFETEQQLSVAVRGLEEAGIYGRRYFFPALNCIPELGKFPECRVAESVASRILCLPLSASQSREDTERVVNSIQTGIRSSC
jgi:dTDP-4-amino-4,6-dideoxygalactose transaminase